MATLWLRRLVPLPLLLLVSVCISACNFPIPVVTPEAVLLPTPEAHSPGVADLWQNRPASGETVEVDAYLNGMGVSRGPAILGPCGLLQAGSAMTDRPILTWLVVAGLGFTNLPPDDAPWFIAVPAPPVDSNNPQPFPQYPYHARFRGHLDDPVYAECPRAGRIFVVEEVVQVYEAESPEPPAYFPWLPEDFADWPRYHDAASGYSVPYPPDWSVEPLVEEGVEAAVALRGPQWPDFPVTLRVHPGETTGDLSAIQARWPSQGAGLYLQGNMPFIGLKPTPAPGQSVFVSPLPPGMTPSPYDMQWVQTQGLAGYAVYYDDGDATARSVAILFSAYGHTYELALRYPVGFDASQTLLTAYTLMVEDFRLDVPLTPTPTPTATATPHYSETLGPGPFLSEAEARERAAQWYEQWNEEDRELRALRLVPEAEARRLAPCAFFGLPRDGIWLLTVYGDFGAVLGTTEVYMLMDAVTGDFLCSAEIPK